MTVYIELPAVYIDDVEFDTLELGAGVIYLAVINKNPEADQDNVRQDSLISFDVVGLAGVPPILASTIVKIRVTDEHGNVGDLVTAFDGSTFLPPYSGPESSVNDWGSVRSIIQFVIDPTIKFDSLSVVEVFVTTDAAGYPDELEVDWSFTVEDLTAPQLVSAVPQDQFTIRLTFNEAVDQESTDGDSSALNPDNYVFTVTMIPAVTIEPVSVTSVSDLVVDVVIDIEMTPGASYTVTVDGVTDIYDNEILAPYNAITFDGYSPPVPELRSFDLWRMLPRKNRDEDDGTLWKFIACLQEVTDLVLYKIDAWTNIIDPDIADELFLDAILQDLGNPTPPLVFTLDVIGKRKLIRVLVEIYRLKGTEQGIISVVRFFLGVEITIVTYSGFGWLIGIHELGDGTEDDENYAIIGTSDPLSLYSFEIHTIVSLTDEQREQITSIAHLMKPAHTHLVRIVEP